MSGRGFSFFVFSQLNLRGGSSSSSSSSGSSSGGGGGGGGVGFNSKLFKLGGVYVLFGYLEQVARLIVLLKVARVGRAGQFGYQRGRQLSGFPFVFLFFFCVSSSKKKKNRSGGRVRVSFRDVRPPQWCNEVRIEAEEEEEESCRVSGG